MDTSPSNPPAAPAPRVHQPCPSGKMALGQFQQQLLIPGMSSMEATSIAIQTHMGMNKVGPNGA